MVSSYDESIGQLTNQTNKRMMRFLNAQLEFYDITLEQWLVLLKLSQQEQINQKQLAQKVDKDQPTLTRILDILERKNFVKRQHVEGDKRAFSLYITDDGLQLKKQVEPYLEGFFEKIVSGISNHEIEIYKNVLMKICRNISHQEMGDK